MARTMKNLMLLTALVLMGVAAPQQTRAQGYDGVIAGEDGAAGQGAASDVYNPARGYSEEIYAPDYHAKRAARATSNTDAYRADLQAQRTEAATARAAQAKAAQDAIDARVKKAVNAPSQYGARLDGMRVPPQTPTPPTKPAVTTPATPKPPAGGAPAPGGGDRGGGNSVLENMMNALQ